MRQRERTVDRVWSPVAPNFLTYVYGGQLFGRTYGKVSVSVNVAETGVGSTPFGHFFQPPPQPPLVLIGSAATLSTFNSSGGSSLTGSNPNPIPISAPITPPAVASNVLHEGDGEVVCGLRSTPLKPTSFLVQDVTILADSSNKGTVWVNAQLQQGAGAGFPLAAGAAISKGVLGSGKLVDLSTVFIIGTDAADKVYIDYEQ